MVERKLEFLRLHIRPQGNGKTAIFANRVFFGNILHSGAGIQNRLTCGFAFGVGHAADLHGKLDGRMLLKVGAVLGERLDKLLLPQNGLREEFQQLVLQSVLLAFKICLDKFQLCDLCVQFRVLDDAGIAGGKRLDLSVA